MYISGLKVKVLIIPSCPTLSTPWTEDCQAPLSMGFSRQEYWSGLPFSPEVLLDPGIETASPALQADSLLLSHPGSPHFRFNQLHKDT